MDYDDEETRACDAVRIRESNDRLRMSGQGGKVYMTRAVRALPPQTTAAVLNAIKQYDAFSPETDPSGEHARGSVSVDGKDIKWLISNLDAFAELGSPGSADRDSTRRLLIIMTAAEHVPDLKDRAEGALLGLAVGDAVGTTLEFEVRDSRPPLVDMIGGGPFHLPAGMWTDDTSMALALAESLIGKDALDPADLMNRFVDWWKHGAYSATGECFDIGETTRVALAQFERTGDAIAGSTNSRSAGNGSLMRLSPVAIWGVRAGERAMRDAARLQSATTHAAPACLDACEGYALILRLAILGVPFEEAAAAAAAVRFAEPVGSILAGSWREKDRKAIASSGYVAHSLEAALWCVASTNNFRDAVLLAANLGGDADTTAAITGQLAGALYGANGIPEQWLAKVAWRERLTNLALALLG